MMQGSPQPLRHCPMTATSPKLTKARVATSSSRGLVLGQSRLELPHSEGMSFFQLTTHCSGRSTLRHFLSGLHKLERQFREVELIKVNNIQVSGWSHTDVTICLRQHLARVVDAHLCLTVRGRDQFGQKHEIEVTFDLIYEDGVSIGDKARAMYDVIVRVKDKIIHTPDVTDVQYTGCSDIRVRHGALTGYFLTVGGDHTMYMDLPPRQEDAYVFKCFKFLGHDESGGGGGAAAGGGDGTWPRLCVLQQRQSGRYVTASATTSCLLTDDDRGFRTDVETITKPDCHFFVMHCCGNEGDNSFCLSPLVLPDYYLRYDAVEGLKLQKCCKPPYKNFAVLRYFTFDFVTVPQ